MASPPRQAADLPLWGEMWEDTPTSQSDVKESLRLLCMWFQDLPIRLGEERTAEQA